MNNIQYINELYEKLHQNPELAFQEWDTANLIADELTQLGFTVQTKVGGTGVVGVLKLGQGPVLALRADMDALPIQEETEAPYSSRNSGIMHACGHDSHMAMLLGACTYASQNQTNLGGTLLAVFQPAEEIVAGAKAMLKDGVFAELSPHQLVGVHNWPQLPAGSIGLQSGPLTSYADRFTVTFRGEGGHGAFPHTTVDPISMATAAIQGVFSLIQRKTDARRPRTISFGTLRGGTMFNVIPETVVAEGTVRTLHLEDQDQMVDILHKAFTAAACLHGGHYELVYQRGVPAVINDPIVAEELGQFFEKEMADTPVITSGLASLIGEDLSYFLEQIPGVLLLIGSGQEGQVSELHNPRFLVPNQTLLTGYKALTSVIRGYLELE